MIPRKPLTCLTALTVFACVLTECGSSPPNPAALATARHAFQADSSSLISAFSIEGASNGSSSSLSSKLANHFLVQSLRAFQHKLSETRWPAPVKPSIDRLGEVTVPVIADLEAHPSSPIGVELFQYAASNPGVVVAWQNQLAVVLHQLGYDGKIFQIHLPATR